MKQFKHRTLLARASKMLLAMLCFACFGVAKAQTVVYSEGFENMSSAEDLTAAGWISWGATGGYIGIETSYVNTGSKALNINAWDCSNSSDNEVAGLPILSNPINTLQITFSYRQRSGGNVKVGYLTDANDASTFVELETLPSSTSGYSTATVDLSAAPATAARIAIEQFKWYECYIDDIEVSLRSTCATPTNLAVNYTSGATTATVTWSGEASKYNINVNGTVTNNVTSPYTLSVVPGTTYNIKVQADCGGEQSGWVSTSFFSGCPDTYPIPYAYGFEDAGAIECWTISGGDGYSSIYDNEWSESNVGYNAARTGDNYFMFYYTETPPQYLISPQLSGIENGLHVEFYYRQYEQGVETFQVGYSTSDNAPASFTWGNEITASTSYQRFSANYPKETKYVAIKHTSNYEYLLYIDDFLFEESASCLEPTEVTASNATTTGATISWTPGGDETTWDIYVTNDINDVPADNTTPTVVNISTKPYNLTGLSPCTIYYVYVRAKCSETSASAWSIACIFHTECEPMALPYSYDFEDDELPVSWSTINTNTSYCGVNIMAPSSSSTNRTLTFYMGSSTGTLVAVLPEVDAAYPLNGYQISFDACYANNNGGKLAIGIMTDPADFSTFTLIEEVDITDGYSTFGSHTVMFNTYTGNGRYIAIRDIYTQSGYVLVDNIEVTALPSCIPPTNLAASVTSNSAELSWTASGSETAWTLYYKKSSVSEYTSIVVNVNPYTLTGLDASTTYQFYVVANCSDTDNSAPSEVYTFKTTFAAVTTFPWTEDFNELTEANSIPDGWDNSEGTIPDTSPAYKWCYNTSTSGNGATSGTSHDGTNCVRFNSYNNSNGKYNFLKTVPLALPAEPDMQLTFWYKNPTGGDFSVYISTDGGETHETALVTGLTGIANWTKSEPVNLSSYAGKTVIIVFKGTSNYGNGDAYIYLDDVTVDVVPSCVAPTHLAATNITSNSADLSWIAGGSEEEWTLYYKKAADESYTEILNVTENPYTLEGLNAATAYQFYVVANCSDTDTSDPSSVYSFSTDCGAIASLPWTENFDSYTGSTSSYVPSGYPNDEMPNCWRFLNRSETSSAYPQVFISSHSGYPISGNCLFFKSSNTTPLYAVLPTFAEDIAGLQLTFTYRNEGTTTNNGTLIVGYMTDPMDATTFTTVQTCDRTTTLTEKEVMFTDAPTGSYIAFMYQGGSSNNYYMSIDNVTVNIKPSCFKPTELSATNITENSAVLSWTPGGSETSWMLNYREVGKEEWIENSVTGNPSYTLTDLTAQTTYEFYVVASCSDTDTSEPSNTYTFTTKCAAIADFPWSEDFEDYNNNTLVDCWDNSASTSSTLSSYPERIWGVYSYSDNKMIRMYNYYVQSGTALINTPRIVLPSEGEYYLTFDYAHNADCGAFAVKVSTDNGTTFTELASYTQGSGSSYSDPGEFTPATISLADYAGKAIILQFFANANFGNGAIFVDNVRVGSPIEKIKFAKEGYATYYNSGYDVVLPTGMKAKIVTESASDGTLTYQTIDGNVPAGTAVMLQVAPTEAAQTLIVELATATTGSYTGNKLHGSDVRVDITTLDDYSEEDNYYYMLSYDTSGANIGWYWDKENTTGTGFWSGAHKAWLVLPKSLFQGSGAPFLGLPGWEDTTGIVPVGVNPENGEWYTLQGLKIGKKPTTAGVYIHNGRKVVIK